MADNTQRPIVIKRIKRGGGMPHGGAWKIAYSDFVTAMMAFFLLMWLLGSTTKGDLQGIADYFQTPLKIAFAGGKGTGDATSVIPGGGKDLTRRDLQQLKSVELPDRRRTIDVKAAQAEIARQENVRLKALKEKLEEIIDAAYRRAFPAVSRV